MVDDEDTYDIDSSETSVVASDEGGHRRKPRPSVASIEDSDKNRFETNQEEATPSVTNAESIEQAGTVTEEKELAAELLPSRSKKTSTVSSSDGDTKREEGGSSEGKHSSDGAPESSERGKRRLVESVLEQKRRASRESSRRSQDRQRKRIEHLNKEEIRLQNANQKLRSENQNFRQARESLQEALDARQQQQQQQQQQQFDSQNVSPAMTMLQQLAMAGIAFPPQHQPATIMPSTQQQTLQPAQNQPFMTHVPSQQQQLNMPLFQRYQQQLPCPQNSVVQSVANSIIPQASPGGGNVTQQPSHTIPASPFPADQLLLHDLQRISSQSAHQEVLQALSSIVNTMAMQTSQVQPSQLHQAQSAAQLQSLLAVLCLLNVALNQSTSTATTAPASSSSMPLGQGFPTPTNAPDAPSHTSPAQPHQDRTSPQQQQPHNVNIYQGPPASFPPLVTQQQHVPQSAQVPAILQNQMAMMMNALTQQTGQHPQHAQQQQQQQQQEQDRLLEQGHNLLSLLAAMSNSQHQHHQHTTLSGPAGGGNVNTENQPPLDYTSSGGGGMQNAVTTTNNDDGAQHNKQPHHPGRGTGQT